MSTTAEESQPHPVASAVVSFAKEAKGDGLMRKAISTEDRLNLVEVATDDEDLFADAERTVHGPSSHEAVPSAAAAKDSNSSVTPIQAAAAATPFITKAKKDGAANQPISAEAVTAASATATAAAAAAAAAEPSRHWVSAQDEDNAFVDIGVPMIDQRAMLREFEAEAAAAAAADSERIPSVSLTGDPELTGENRRRPETRERRVAPKRKVREIGPAVDEGGEEEEEKKQGDLEEEEKEEPVEEEGKSEGGHDAAGDAPQSEDEWTRFLKVESLGPGTEILRKVEKFEKVEKLKSFGK
jgi:hypothetical protein